MNHLFDYKSHDYIKNYCQNTDLEIRNNFRDDVFIVIAGYQTYQKDLIEFYKKIKNVIFVIDEDESNEIKNNISKNEFEYIIAKVPQNRGFGNVNIQCASSFQGVMRAKERGAKYVLRMRSDQIMIKFHEFIQNQNFDKLGSICVALNEPRRNRSDNFEYVNYKLSEHLNYSKDFSKLGTNYILDYCLSGPVDDLLTMFDYCENDQIYAPAEHKLLINYLMRKKIPLDNSINNLRNLFSFMLPIFLNKDIDFLSIKQGYHNWKVAMPLQPDIYGV